MSTGQKILFVVSSLANAMLGFFAFVIMLFATSPSMDDVTMRAGFYVLNAVILTAIAGVVMPWIAVSRGNTRAAIRYALAPALLLGLAAVAFLLLDSWLNRTFS